ncbi:MAG: HAMP domain-containing histidine kinase [Nitrospirota bacterium]|nr:HAMP domain-containing histidine kinase [Nitrospirota bacterium]
MNSLKARLSWGLSASLVVLFALQFVVIGLMAPAIYEDRMVERLEHDAEALLGALRIGPLGGVTLGLRQVGPVFSRPFSGHYFRVVAGPSEFLSRSLWDEGFPDTKHPIQRARGPRGQPLLVVTRSYTRRGVQVVISVGEDLSHVSHAVRAMQVQVGLISLGFLSLLVVLQRAIVGYTLKPLKRVRADLEALERGQATRVTEQVPDEMVPLVAGFNQLLDSLQRRVGRSRTAMGNLAHALKTPLSVIRQTTENDGLDSAGARAEIVGQVERITGLVERELGRARLAGQARPGERVDLERELTALARAVSAAHREREVTIDVRVPKGKDCGADREDLLELFGNLLDNACKWATARVRLTVEEVPGMQVRVEDDGPGCPDEELKNIARRGVRLDEAAPGHGLGLAIAGDVADSYGGTLTFGRSEELGGFLARVTIPPVGETEPTA